MSEHAAPMTSPAAPAERLRIHFADLRQQTHAARLGMWIFLGSEVLLFSALFGLYFGYRAHYPEIFRKAAGHTDLWLGSANTGILICASFLVAVAVHVAREDRSRLAGWLLVGAVLLGALFLGLKGAEYVHHFSEGIYPGRFYRFDKLHGEGARIFFTLYYVMTGLHALHVFAGMALLGWLARGAFRETYTESYYTPLELGGMYCHLVDVVWVFLWPMFYLMR